VWLVAIKTGFCQKRNFTLTQIQNFFTIGIHSAMQTRHETGVSGQHYIPAVDIRGFTVFTVKVKA
jgi:hypothetical protein